MKALFLLRKPLLLAALCLLASLSFCQVTQQWVRKYNSPTSTDQASAVALDSSGNVYVTGNNGTIKYDTNGNKLWAKRLASPPNTLVIDGNGNIYTSAKHVISETSSDFVTTKYDTDGKRLWVKRHNHPIYLFDLFPCSMGVDRSGNVYVAGTSRNPWYSFTTIKYDANGNELWVKEYSNPGNDYIVKSLALDTLGNVYVTGEGITVKYDSDGKEYWAHTNEAIYNAIAVDHLGNVYVTGEERTAKYDATGAKVWVKTVSGISLAVDPSDNVYIIANGIKKYDTHGKQLWAQNDGATALMPDGSGNVYATGGNATIKYTADGKQLWITNKGGSSLTVDRSGNVYVAGTTGNYPNTNYATIKYDVAGGELWVKTYNGPGNVSDAANALALDSAGNVYVTGYSDGDIATVKYDTYGKQRWVKRYNRSGYFLENVVSVAVDGFGNGYIAATGMTSDTYEESFTIIKYNADGKEQWVKTYPTSVAAAMVVDVAGNVYVAGAVGPDFGSVYLTIKYDTNGNERWVKTYDGLWSGAQSAHALAVDRFGNVYVTGQSLGIPDPYFDVDNSDYATIKYDPNGKELWVRRHDADAGDNEVAKALALDSAGNVYVTGTSNYTNVTIKYDTNGNELWIKEAALRDANVLAVDKAGNVYLTGTIYYGIATIKYDTNGNEQWVRNRNSTCNECGYGAAALAADSAGNVYMTGSLNGDYITIKYDRNGSERWVKTYNGPADGNDAASALALDRAGNVYVTGTSGAFPNNTDYGTIKYVQTLPFKVDAGEDKTTYYLPYTPTCTFLIAHAKGGLPPYQYSWSPDVAASQSTVVCPAQTTTYTVTVTDANGLKAKDKVLVNVIDVRCGSNKDKVLVCYHGATLCLNPWEAFWLLWQGATLSSCPSAPVTDLKSRNKAVQEAQNTPKTFKIYNAPNPFTNSTTIYYELPMDGQASVTVYDAIGREITTLENGKHKAGVYNRVFTAAGLSKGMYYYRVNYTTNQHQVMRKTGKMLVEK